MPTTLDPGDPMALEPVRPFPILRRLAQVTVAGCAIALLSLFAREKREIAPAVPPPSAQATGSGIAPSLRAARPALPLALTAPRFHLDDPAALEPVRAEPARLNPLSGQREDVLVQGDFGRIEMPYLRLTLTETLGSEAGQSLFVTLARRAAEAQGLAVLRTGARGSIETKFGAIETLEITLGGEGKRACAGFTSRKPGLLRLDGWLCAPLGQAPEPRAVVCALDKVTLNGQAWPEGEGAFAALAPLRDPACGPRAVAERDVGGETGSIPSRRARKNEAKLRPSGQARP